MATPNISGNELLKRLKDAIALPLDVVPPGFLRADEWAKKWKLSLTHAQKLLASGYKRGFLERKLLRVNLGGKRSYSTFHYKEKPLPAKASSG